MIGREGEKGGTAGIRERGREGGYKESGKDEGRQAGEERG